MRVTFQGHGVTVHADLREDGVEPVSEHICGLLALGALSVTIESTSGTFTYRKAAE